MSLPVSTFNTDLSANKLRKTYIQGFIDISGGDLNLQNGAFNMFNGNSSADFRISGDHLTTRSYPSLQAVDVSLSRLILLNSISGNVDDTFAVVNQKISGITYDATYDRTFIDNDLSLSGNLSVGGNTNFPNHLPTYSGVAGPTLATQLTTKTYVDTAISGNKTVLLSGNNTWSGNNQFSNYFPTWTGVGDPIQGNQFVTKSYVDNNGGTILLTSNNTWTGNNLFNRYPTYNGVGDPSLNNQFATKSYVDNNGGSAVLYSENTWTGNNRQTYYPTFVGVGNPTQGNQFVTKSYVDNNGGGAILSAENTWTGNNRQTYYPTFVGVGNPTQGNQFVTKSYVDSNGGTLLLSSNNIWTGINNFNGDVSLNGNIHISGTLYNYVPAVGFDGGFPGTDYTTSARLDAGGVI